MTLDAAYDLDARKVSVLVVIDGVAFEDVLSVSWAFSVGRVPTATVSLRRPPFVPAYHDPVTIDVGFDGILERQFTGVVLDAARSGGDVTVECVGQSWVLELEYKTLVATLSNVDAAAAIEQMLISAGTISYFVDLPAWQLAVTRDRPLSFQTYSDAIMKIAEVLLARWFETPTGQIVVREAQAVPGIVAARIYFSMRLLGSNEEYPEGISSGRPRLRGVTRRTAAREVKNEILVLGASLTTVDGNGNEVSTRLQAVVTGPNQLMLAPDSSQAYNALVFSNELIETQAKVDEVAVKLFQLHNRLTTYIDVQIDGDPRVRLGETLQVEDPAYTEVTGRLWLEGYQSSLTASGFETTLSLVAKEGGRTNWEPVADFVVSIEMEWITDRYWLVVTFDGRASYDFDGTIATYAWTDNQAPPVVTGSTAIVMVKADPGAIVGTWNVTLTVTDDQGASRSVTKVVPTTVADSAVRVPALCVAFDVAASASPDGGQFWYDQAV